MIDWFLVVSSSIWIVGFAIILAVVSYAQWDASMQGVSIRTLLSNPVYTRLLYIGLTFVTVGMALSSAVLWRRIVFAVLSVFNLIVIFTTNTTKS